MPKYFKQNNPLIKIGLKCMTPETVKQYQKEERSLIAHRYKASKEKTNELLAVMSMDNISKGENVRSLSKDLSVHYKNKDFLNCETMGELVRKSLENVLEMIPVSELAKPL